MATNEFKTPLLERNKGEGPTMSYHEYARSPARIKELALESKATSGVFIADSTGLIRLLSGISLKRNANREYDHAWVNISNTDFAPAMAGKPLLKTFLDMKPHADLPEGAMTGTPVPADILAGAMQGENVHLFGMSMSHPAEGEKSWIEGHSTDAATLDALEADYGAAAKGWAQSIAHAHQYRGAISAVYRRLVEAQGNALQEALGRHYSIMDLHLDEPLMHLVPMTKTSHPEDYRAYRAKLGPYGVAPAPPVHHAPVAGGGGGIDASALAEAMLSQAEKEERKKLAEGSIMLRGVNVGGTIDEATGVVSDVALPTETEAFKDVCKSTSASEMTAALKRILDTINRERVAGNVNATHRDMRDMDRLAVANLATGNWSATPITRSKNSKANQFGVICLLPYSQSMLERMNTEARNRAFREAVDGVHSGDPAAREYIGQLGSDVSYQHLKSMFANTESLILGCFVVTIGGKSFLLVYTQKALAFLIDTDTFHWFNVFNDERQRMNFIMFMILRFDWFVCMLVEGTQHFETYAAIKQNDPAAICKARITKATSSFADDLKEMAKLVQRNKPCEEKVPLLCDGSMTAPPAKKVRLALPAPPAPAQAADAANPIMQANSPYAATYGGGWGNGWGNEAGGDDWGAANSAAARAERDKKLGDLVVKGDIRFVLAPELKDICPDFNTLGKACPGCNRKHVPLRKLSQEKLGHQIAYVERNKTKIRFSAKGIEMGLKLPQNKMHLVAGADGQFGGERS